MEWKRIKNLDDKSCLEKFQKEFGIEIPISLKHLILHYNGARPSEKLIKLENGNVLEVKMLLSYNEEDTENIYDCIEFFKKKYNNKILPFATEPSGNYFCMNLEDYSIIYWIHEEDSIIKVSNSLKQFLQRLY